MAFLPPDVFPSWAEDGTDITVPIASFNLLTAALADAATGDARAVLLSICSTAFEWYNELAEKPTALTVSYQPRRINSSGDFVGKLSVEYKFTFETEYPEGTVSDEPV